MGFSGVTGRGSSIDTANDTSISRNPTSNIIVGQLLFACGVTDNYATVAGASNEHTVTDGKGNLWIKIAEYTQTSGVSSDGCTVSTFGTRVTTQINTTDAVTLILANAVFQKCFALVEATVTAGNTFAVEQVGTGFNATEASVSSIPSREYLLLGHGGAEGGDATKTPDADYTELHDIRSAGTGFPVNQHVVYRIATLTDDTCTSTTWEGGTDWMFTLAALYETTPSAGNPWYAYQQM